MEKNLKSNLQKTLEGAFYTEAFSYKDYVLELVNNYSNKFGGEYIPAKKLLIVQKDESNCRDLELATAIHELAHHIEYIQVGYTKHDALFHKIQKKLLCSAFEQKLLNPSRLALEEEYLSRYSEKTKIKQECLDYMSVRKINQIYRIEITYFKDKINNEGNYQFSPIIGGWYCFKRQED